MNGELSFAHHKIGLSSDPISKSVTRKPKDHAYCKHHGWNCDPVFPRQFHPYEDFRVQSTAKAHKSDKFTYRKMRGKE